MNVFDIIGPAMIGPSSSHTAGAARAGLVARLLLGERPVRADITLYGSFAKTYGGHGTDRAIIGGILGYALDDSRLRDSFRHAKAEGLEIQIQTAEEAAKHPNTVRINLTGAAGGQVSVTVESVGGGVIHVVDIDGGQVYFSAEYHTTVVFNADRPGTVAKVSAVFAKYQINIAFMRVFRNFEGKDAIMVIETDQGADAAALEELRAADNIQKVIAIPPFRT